MSILPLVLYSALGLIPDIHIIHRLFTTTFVDYTSYDLMIPDLTSTYFEADPPFLQSDKRRFGYSRDHRPDCVQVVIALVVTPEGLPLAYEVLPGNTRDCTTLRGFLEHIERQYGKARLLDRGVPREAELRLLLDKLRLTLPAQPLLKITTQTAPVVQTFATQA